MDAESFLTQNTSNISAEKFLSVKGILAEDFLSGEKGTLKKVGGVIGRSAETFLELGQQFTTAIPSFVAGVGAGAGALLSGKGREEAGRAREEASMEVSKFFNPSGKYSPLTEKVAPIVGKPFEIPGKVARSIGDFIQQTGELQALKASKLKTGQKPEDIKKRWDTIAGTADLAIETGIFILAPELAKQGWIKGKGGLYNTKTKVTMPPKQIADNIIAEKINLDTKAIAQKMAERKEVDIVKGVEETPKAILKEEVKPAEPIKPVEKVKPTETAEGFLEGMEEYHGGLLIDETGAIKLGEGKPQPKVLTPKDVDVQPWEFGATTLFVGDRHPILKPTIENTIAAEQSTQRWIQDYAQKTEQAFDKVEKPGLVQKIFGRKGTEIRDVDLMIEGKKPVPENLKGFVEEIRGITNDVKSEIVTKMKSDTAKSLSPKQQEYLKFKIEGGGKPKYVRQTTADAVDDMLTQFKEMEQWGFQDYFPHIFKGQYKYLNENGGIIASGKTAKLAKANFEEFIEKNPQAKDQTFFFTNDFYELATIRKQLNPDLVNHLEYLGTKLPRKEFFRLINKTEKIIKDEIGKAGIEKGESVKVDMSGIATLQPGKKFSGHFMKRRTELRGEETDPFRAMISYIFSIGRKLGLEDAKKQAYYFADSLPPTMPKAKEFIRMQADNAAGRYNLIDEVVDKTIGKRLGAKPFLASRVMRAGLSLQTKLKLGYAPAKTMINRVGGAMHTLVKEGTGNYIQGRKLLAKKDPQLLEALERSKHLIGIEQPFGAESARPWGVRGDDLSRWRPMGYYQRVEVFKNRPEAFAAGYVEGLKRFGGDKKLAEKYAVDSARLTQGLYETSAKPVIVRGPIAGAAYQFKQYLNNEIRFMSQLTPQQWATYIPGIMVMGGTRGALLTIKSIIGVSVVEQGIDKFAEWLNREEPHLHRGIFGLVGLDVSAPATWQIPNQVRDWIGPTFNDAIKTAQMLKNGLEANGWTNEEINDYFRQLAPVGYNLTKGLQLLTTGETREGQKLMYKGEKQEGAIKLLGARTVGESQTSDTARYMNQQKRIMQKKYDVLSDNLFKAKTSEETEKIFGQMLELKGIQTPEEMQDMVNGILKKAKSMTLTEEARVFLTMPKKIKREYLKK